MLRKFKLLGDMGLDEMGGHRSLSVPAFVINYFSTKKSAPISLAFLLGPEN